MYAAASQAGYNLDSEVADACAGVYQWLVAREVARVDPNDLDSEQRTRWHTEHARAAERIKVLDSELDGVDDEVAATAAALGSFFGLGH